MQIRLLIATLMLLLAMAGKAQVFQINNTPMNFTRGLKARDLLIAPKGCDTTALSNPKWGESTAGALFVDTCNNRLYFYNGLKWNQVTGGGGGVDSFYYNFRNLNDTTMLWDRGDGTVDTLAFSSGGTSLIGSYVDSVTTVGDTLFYWKGGNSTFVTNIATAAAGGDTTIFEIVLDSTGQPNRRVLFSETGNKIGSDNTFLWDKVNNKLVINGTNVSIGGPTAKLVVVGRAVFGVVNTDALQVQALTEVTDTSTYKPMVVDAVGIAYKMNRWPSGSDTTGIGSLYIRNQFAAQENKKFSVIQGKVDALDFNTTSSIADSTQRLTWDDGNGTLNIGLKGGQVNLAVGQEQVARVYNDAGVTLNDGDVVYITGAQGNRIKVQKAVNTDAAIAYATLGMVTETITAGSEGFVTILGTVNHLNTSSFAEGTELYLSGTAGGYTSTKPTYPAAIVSIGRVERSHATVGSIYVNVRPELPTVASYGKNAGGDSTILLLTNGQRFAAKDSVGAGGGGGTPAGSNGQVQFNNSGAFGASSNFNWDAANNRLGILTASPQRPLHIAGTSQGVLLPRLTTAQKNAISTPQDGEIVYDTDQRNLSTYSNATSTWIPARSLLGYNSSTSSLFVTDGIGVVTGVNTNNTILQYKATDFPGTGHVIIGKAAAAAVSGTPTGLTIIGNDAGYYNSSSYSTLLGQLAGYNTTTGTGSTIVGAYAYAQGPFITGAGNSIFGAFNHRYGVAGAYNSSFGYQTNWLGGGNYNITLGAFVDQQSTTATGYLNIGNVIYGLGLHQSASNSSTPTTAGQIGIGVAQSGISASAKLQVDATDKGFLPPRMTTTQMNAISSPAAGLQIYNTTLSQPHYRDGSTWQAMVGMTFGTAAPTSTPTAVGNFFLDTTNKKLYVATGTASSADWTILN